MLLYIYFLLFGILSAVPLDKINGKKILIIIITDSSRWFIVLLGATHCRRSVLPSAILALARPVTKAFVRRVVQGSPGPTRPLRLVPLRTRRVADFSFETTSSTSDSSITDTDIDHSTRISQDGNEGAINNQSGGTAGNLSVHFNMAPGQGNARFRPSRRRGNFRRQRPVYQDYEYYNYDYYYPTYGSRRAHHHPRRLQPQPPRARVSTTTSVFGPTTKPSSTVASTSLTTPPETGPSKVNQTKLNVLKELVADGILTPDDLSRYDQGNTFSFPTVKMNENPTRSRRFADIESNSFPSETTQSEPISTTDPMNVIINTKITGLDAPAIEFFDQKESDQIDLASSEYIQRREQQFWLDITPIFERYFGEFDITISTHIPSLITSSGQHRHRRSVNRYVTSNDSETEIETRSPFYVYEKRNRTQITIQNDIQSFESKSVTYHVSKPFLFLASAGLFFFIILVHVAYSRCK